MERCSSNMGDYSEEPPPAATRMATTLVKTRLCKHMSRGHCMFGEKCHFAHSQHEITARPNFQKTKLCLSFLRHGCSSSSCKYAHGPAELNPASSALLAAEVEARRREESAIDTSIGSASSYLFSAPVAHVINSSRRPSATASDAPDGVNSDFYPLLATLEQAATPPMASRGDAGATSIIPRSAWYRQEEVRTQSVSVLPRLQVPQLQESVSCFPLASGVLPASCCCCCCFILFGWLIFVACFESV
eukprot:TRINITY_DN45250_c0_g1_i4.p1 TRINITY_DN45250_c0_g1~~TRINITY_DN45250_c0_g1_i4.p1  ORF type:complete len:246 (+),score=7.64 TRINITY_DN45250_c0_g1_i4:171-908(+)